MYQVHLGSTGPCGVMDLLVAQVVTGLPRDLSEVVVRRIRMNERRLPVNLKSQIENQRFLLAKIINWQFGAGREDFPQVSYFEVYRYLESVVGGTGDLNNRWLSKSSEEKWDLYRTYGPHAY